MLDGRLTTDNAMKKKYVAYYRVSTERQGVSGLGLDAQKTAVMGTTSNGTVVAEFEEIESGKNNQRVMLQKAIEAAKQLGATLVIAKLDRLSRNAAFIFALRDSGVEFVCADMPEANTLTIGIMAVMAQHEREMISSRTKSALAELKARGVKLGSPQNLTSSSREASIAVRSAKRRECKEWMRASALIQQMRNKGASLNSIASTLNSSGYTTRYGKAFTATSVSRLIQRTPL
jgi:DNA invertase Pin-like site-specific DNA recombinase